MDGRTIYNKLSTTGKKTMGSIEEIKLEGIISDYKKEDVIPIENNGESIELYKGDKLYFKIRRLYPEDQKFQNYGQKISVYVISIGNPHIEYLVNFDYIINQLKKNGLKLTHYKPFSEYMIPKNNINMSFVEYKWSIMNTYLEFQSIV